MDRVLRPRLAGWRLVAVTWIPPAVIGAIFAVQWFVTSPGVTTDVEFRLIMLAACPCLTIALCARWVDLRP